MNPWSLFRPVSLLAGIMLCAAWQPASAQQGDPAAGREKSQTCAACHGVDGNSTNPGWPSIAGQHAEYLIKQMKDFRDGRRQNDQMSPMAAPLSDQDIADLAAYFAEQTPAKGVTQPENVDVGQRIYRAGNAQTGLAACMACHGPSGIGNPAAKYPSLSGQHAAYSAAQLKAFKAETRNNDANSVMRSIASKMTNAEIEAVSDYVQGLH